MQAEQVEDVKVEPPEVLPVLETVPAEPEPEEVPLLKQDEEIEVPEKETVKEEEEPTSHPVPHSFRTRVSST